MTFQINVDTTTTDIWEPTDFGLFPVTSVTLTVPDLGISDELVVPPLGYFEDYFATERAGLAPLYPNCGVQVSFSASGTSQIGDPNVIDTIPTITGDPSYSRWSSLWTQFGITLQDGTTFNLPGGMRVYFQESFLGPTQVTEPATLDIHPETLNKKSKGNYVTCYIELPEGYNVEDIDIATVVLMTDSVSVSAEPSPTEVGDYNGNDIPDFMVKFDRQPIQNGCNAGAVGMTVYFQTFDGTSFEGNDIVLVIDKDQ
jgi:hypothetical protein